MSKLQFDAVLEIRCSTASNKELADRFNVTEYHVAQIRRNKVCNNPPEYRTFEAAVMVDNYRRVRSNAKTRDIEFDLSLEEATKLFNSTCHYCGATGSNIGKLSLKGHAGKVYMYNGIDRVDNTKGYHVGNVVACCKVCNRMKSTMSTDAFINKCTAIADTFKNK